MRSDTDEDYSLTVEYADDAVKATITAENYFGVRHGIETLFQVEIQMGCDF